MTRLAGSLSSDLSPLGEVVQDYLGADLDHLDPVTEIFAAHQVIDIDLALAAVRAEHGGRLIGITGPMRAGMESFPEFLNRSHWSFRPGAVSYQRMPTGPDTERRVISCGITLLEYAGTRIAMLQRTAYPQYGREHYTLELVARDEAGLDALLGDLRARLTTTSVLRGQVISFQRNPFDQHAPGSKLTFLPRPDVPADDVILPAGDLDRIVDHVVGIGEHRERLLATGQHLKRGVLLYGPPGTGKTHVVRHLLTRTEGTTVVLLSGRTLGLLADATALARTAQPAIVVLEDCDLVAEERGGETNAILFEALEALDGSAGDADVTFVLTTNRPDLLERALAERPGRVDLAVEIGRPDLDGRLRLLRLYAAPLLAAGQLSEDALAESAAATEGVTASFAKELVRRVVLLAATADRDPSDDDLREATERMQSESEAFTRVVLGGEPGAYAEGDGLPLEGSAEPGETAYGASWRMTFDA